MKFEVFCLARHEPRLGALGVMVFAWRTRRPPELLGSNRGRTPKRTRLPLAAVLAGSRPPETLIKTPSNSGSGVLRSLETVADPEPRRLTEIQ